MESLIFSINAVGPIVLLAVIGYFLKKIGFIKPDVAKALNKLVFRVFLPSMLFLNIYKIKSFSDIDFTYVLYAICATFAIFFLSLPIVMMITKKNGQRGVLIQATFRSNYALIGIPLATSLFGDEGAIIATVLSAFIIPIFNVLAVICLTVFSDTTKVSVKNILLGIIKNPLIQGIAAGGIMLGIRAIFTAFGIGFRLSDVTPIYKVLEYLSSVATPIALIVLGAQFEFSALKELKNQIIFGTALRAVIIPALALTVAYFIGIFNGAHFAAFVAMFATPVAVSSVPMAQEMGADSALAGQIVVWTTLVSALSLFVISFILKYIGVFA